MSEKNTRRRRRRRLVIGGLVVVVVAWLALLSVRMVSAYHHDRAGLASLEQVKSNLTPDELTSDSSVRLLHQAGDEFASARSDLSSPLFAPITIVPVVGRQFQAVRALSSAAGTVSEVGADFLTQVHGILDDPHGAGPERVASLRRLAAISASARSRLVHIDTGPSQALVSPLATKRNQFVSQLDVARSSLTKAAAVSASVAGILQGPQTYLVLAANNAEMRNGSGAFLDVGVATTGDGSLHLGEFVPSGAHPLPEGAVPVTGDLQRNWGWLHPSLDMRNLGLTPQFDVTAPLAARMWTSLTGQSIDGVVSLDVAGLRQLLVATGPVVVDGQTVDADDAEQFLLHDQYDGLTDDSADADDRQDLLGSLTGAVLTKLQGQSIDLRSLASAVTSAVAGRHLLLWSANAANQASWVVSGVSGSLTPRSVGVSLLNLGGNKLDQYVPLTVDATTSPSGRDTDVSLRTVVRNQTPDGQSQFVAGPFPGVDVGYGGYSGVLSFNLPATATAITVDGASSLAVHGPDGPTTVVGTSVVIPQGARQTYTVHFRMPGTGGQMTVFPSARVPAVEWTADGKTFPDTTPTTFRW